MAFEARPTVLYASDSLPTSPTTLYTASENDTIIKNVHVTHDTTDAHLTLSRDPAGAPGPVRLWANLLVAAEDDGGTIFGQDVSWVLDAGDSLVGFADVAGVALTITGYRAPA